MRREREHSLFLLKRTVPMLFAIGAVLSVLLLFFLSCFWLKILVAVLLFLAFSSALLFWVLCRCGAKKSENSDRLAAERDRFLSDVAHELKTPLAVISANAEVLEQDLRAQQDQDDTACHLCLVFKLTSKYIADL